MIQARTATASRVRCVVLATALEDAQVNAVARMLAQLRPLPEPAELPELATRGQHSDRRAQFRWRREFEPPRDDEGFPRSRPGRSSVQLDPARYAR